MFVGLPNGLTCFYFVLLLYISLFVSISSVLLLLDSQGDAAVAQIARHCRKLIDFNAFYCTRLSTVSLEYLADGCRDLGVLYLSSEQIAPSSLLDFVLTMPTLRELHLCHPLLDQINNLVLPPRCRLIRDTQSPHYCTCKKPPTVVSLLIFSFLTYYFLVWRTFCSFCFAFLLFFDVRLSGHRMFDR